MEETKKKQSNDAVNVKIQRKFDLVFDSSSEAPSIKNMTATIDGEPGTGNGSDQEFGNEVSSMSDSAKKEPNASNNERGLFELDFADDGESLNFLSAAEAASEKIKESTGKLSIVAPESEADLTLDLEDASEMPAIPAQAIPPSINDASEAPKQSESSPGPDSDDNDAFYNSFFDAEIEMASAKASDESTKATVLYEKSPSNQGTSALGSIPKAEEVEEELTGSIERPNSSQDDQLLEEAKASLESTIQEMIGPGDFSSDNTQEISVHLLNEGAEQTVFHESSSPNIDINFSLGEKTDPSGKFDLKGMHFNEPDSEKTTPLEDPSALSYSEEKREPLLDFSSEDSSRFQGTIRQLREEREELLAEIKILKSQSRELEQDNLTLKVALDEAKIEMSIIRKRHLSEMDEMKYRVNVAEEKRSLAEERAKNAEIKREKLEQRVRIDFNQVKQREKELETKLEMLTIDIDSQVHSRDQKILELRRKIDALEFNMENVAIRELKSQDDKRKLEDKLNKIMKTLRHSIKNLEDDIDQVTEDAESDKNVKMKAGSR